MGRLTRENPEFTQEYKVTLAGRDKYYLLKGNGLKWASNKKPVRIVGILRDITEEKTFVLELEKQKKFYEQILNEIPADIAVFDANHRYLFLNPIAIQDEGLRKWIIGKNDEEYCAYRGRPMSVAEGRRKVFNETVESRRQNEWEESFIGNKGTREYHLRKMYPVFNEQGALDIVIGYGVDITASKLIEEKIRLSETRYRSIFDNSQALLCTHDLEGNVIEVNKTALTTLGYRPEELVGYSVAKILPLAHRNELDTVYLKEIREKGYAEGTMVAITSYGKRIYLLYRNFLVSDGSDTPYVIGFSQDITARVDAERSLKKSEEKYRNLIEKMRLGMLQVDSAENIIYANKQFCAMSGYALNEILEHNVHFLFSKETKLVRSDAEMEAAEGDVLDAYEMEIEAKDGRQMWWLKSEAPVFDSAGKFDGSIGIYLDITQRRKLEQELLKAKANAEHSAKAKEIFLANMSHEIRTPMNAIIGIGKLLAKTQLSGQQNSYLNIIRNASDNLMVIINDLLDFSKIEAGKVTIENIGFNLHATIDTVFHVLKHKAEEKGLVLSYTISPLIMPVLVGDPYRINQVLLNLVSNSIKFTERGEVIVDCSLLNADDQSQEILFKVTDTGIGMSEDFQVHLFEKFKQEDESITRKFGGTGLGMSICKQLIECMGGDIHVQSQKNAGTTISFAVTFPIGSGKDLPDAVNKEADPNVLKGKRILLVEDNAMNRFLANTVLTQYGASVTEAEDGSVAIEILEREMFDIILMDVQMPVKNGLETSVYIRRNIDSNIPIIALTANAFQQEEDRCLQAGMNDFISKPFDEENLVHLLAQWLGRNTLSAMDVDYRTIS